MAWLESRRKGSVAEVVPWLNEPDQVVAGGSPMKLAMAVTWLEAGTAEVSDLHAPPGAWSWMEVAEPTVNPPPTKVRGTLASPW